jgi:2',3'-cyclic-nucleotide 2'-phosphodiesterase (5'-nucleotidase family)
VTELNTEVEGIVSSLHKQAEAILNESASRHPKRKVGSVSQLRADKLYRIAELLTNAYLKELDGPTVQS